MDAPQSCFSRPVVVYMTFMTWTSDHIFSSLQWGNYGFYRGGFWARWAWGKVKGSAREGFPQGNQICGVEPIELLYFAGFPSDPRHIYLPDPKLWLCLYQLFAFTPPNTFKSLKILYSSDCSGDWLITKVEQKFNFLHGWFQQWVASSVILTVSRIALKKKKKSL